MTCCHPDSYDADSFTLGGLIVISPTPKGSAQEDWNRQCFRLFRHLSAGDDVLIRSKSVAKDKERNHARDQMFWWPPHLGRGPRATGIPLMVAEAFVELGLIEMTEDNLRSTLFEARYRLSSQGERLCGRVSWDSGDSAYQFQEFKKNVNIPRRPESRLARAVKAQRKRQPN